MIDPAASYRVTVNSFLTAGGDSFFAFAQGTDPVTGQVDVDAFVTYFRALSPVAPPALGQAVVPLQIKPEWWALPGLKYTVTATVTAPVGATDPVPANNTATNTGRIRLF